MIDNRRLQVCPAAQEGQDRGRRSVNLFCRWRGWDHIRMWGGSVVGGDVWQGLRASVLSHQEAQWAKETLQETQAGLWLSGKTRWTGSE